MTIQQLGCPHCGGMFQVDDTMAGQQVGCPHCQNAIMVPGASSYGMAPSTDYYGGAAPAPWPSQGGYAAGGYPPQYPGSGQPSAPMTYPGGAGGVSTLSCSLCGGGFQVDASLAGQQVACPHCGGIVTLPSAPTPAPAAPQSVPVAPAGWPGGQPTPMPGVPHTPQTMGPVPAPVTPQVPTTPPAAAGSAAPAAAPKSVPTGPAPASNGPGVKVPAPSARKPKPQEAPRVPTGPAAKPSTTSAPTQPKHPAPAPTPAAKPTQMYPPGHKASTSPAAPPDTSPPAKSAQAEPRHPAAPRDIPPAARADKPAPPAEKKPAADMPAAKVPAATKPAKEKVARQEAAEKTTAPASTSVPVTSRDTAAASAKVDSLLPPGTAGQPVPVNRPLPATTGEVGPSAESDLPSGGISGPMGVPTQEGGFVQLYEPVKKVEYAGEEIELHRLTPEERARKRFVKNIVMAIIGVVLLIGLCAILMSMR